MQIARKFHFLNNRKSFIVPLLMGLMLLIGAVPIVLSVSPPFEELQFPPVVRLDNFENLLRTYLFRVALANTAYQILLTTSIALLLAWLIGRTIRLGNHGWWLPLSMAPALFPVALTALLWRQLFDTPFLMRSPFWIISVASVCHAWRMLPWGILLLTVKSPVQRWRAMAIFALWVGFFTLFDPGLVLLFSAGEPFNASHTWSSWLAVNLWVTRNWGASAAMAVLMAIVLVAWFWCLHQSSASDSNADLAKSPPSATVTRTLPSHWAILAILGMAMLWAPIWLLLFHTGPRELVAAISHLQLFALLTWTAISAIAIGLTAILGRAIAMQMEGDLPMAQPARISLPLRYLIVACLPFWPIVLHYAQVAVTARGASGGVVSAITFIVLVLSGAVTIASLVPLAKQYTPEIATPFLWAATLYLLHCTSSLQLWSKPWFLVNGIAANLANSAQPAHLSLALLYVWVLVVGLSIALCSRRSISGPAR